MLTTSGHPCDVYSILMIWIQNVPICPYKRVVKIKTE
jgi:hypothetical protein